MHFVKYALVTFVAVGASMAVWSRIPVAGAFVLNQGAVK